LLRTCLKEKKGVGKRKVKSKSSEKNGGLFTAEVLPKTPQVKSDY
jgi:hypothetical protein